ECELSIRLQQSCPDATRRCEWPFLTVLSRQLPSVASLSCDFGVAAFVAALMRKLAIGGDARQIASVAEDSANSRCVCVLWRFSSEVVGATGFEPATPCAQGRCATRLRYAPTRSRFYCVPRRA